MLSSTVKQNTQCNEKNTEIHKKKINKHNKEKKRVKYTKNTENIKMHFTLFNLQNLCFCVTTREEKKTTKKC